VEERKHSRFSTKANSLGHELLHPALDEGELFDTEIRCTNPDCRKLFFTGEVRDIVTKCPRCGELARITCLP
jgi:hypothetical protein